MADLKLSNTLSNQKRSMLGVSDNYGADQVGAPFTQSARNTGVGLGQAMGSVVDHPIYKGAQIATSMYPPTMPIGAAMGGLSMATNVANGNGEGAVTDALTMGPLAPLNRMKSLVPLAQQVMTKGGRMATAMRGRTLLSLQDLGTSSAKAMGVTE